MIRILTVVQVWNILRATRKKHLELRARGAKTRTVTDIFLLQLTFPYSIQAVKLDNIICW